MTRSGAEHRISIRIEHWLTVALDATETCSWLGFSGKLLILHIEDLRLSLGNRLIRVETLGFRLKLSVESSDDRSRTAVAAADKAVWLLIAHDAH